MRKPRDPLAQLALDVMHVVNFVRRRRGTRRDLCNAAWRVLNGDDVRASLCVLLDGIEHGVRLRAIARLRAALDNPDVWPALAIAIPITPRIGDRRHATTATTHAHSRPQRTDMLRRRTAKLLPFVQSHRRAAHHATGGA